MERSEILEKLRQSDELGSVLAKSYLLAFKQYPELANIDIEFSGPKKYPVLEKTGGFARHQSLTGTNRPVVVVNIETGIEHYTMLMRERAVSAAISSEKMGIDPSALRPEILATFIWLHEFGHAYNYLVNIPDLEKYQTTRHAELQTLPFPGWTPAKLTRALESGGELDVWYSHNAETLKQNGYSTRRAMIEAQERAYHAIRSEDFPDQFAANIIKKNFQRLFATK